jgi:hypothetical protein
VGGLYYFNKSLGVWVGFECGGEIMDKQGEDVLFRKIGFVLYGVSR